MQEIYMQHMNKLWYATDHATQAPTALIPVSHPGGQVKVGLGVCLWNAVEMW